MLTISTSSISNRISTNSNLDDRNATTDKIIKGDIDIYGNIINYDPEDWVGEDFIPDKIITSEKIIKNENVNIGTLDINVTEELLNIKSNILISLIDSHYNIHNVYIYYRNNSHEKVELQVGKYKINSISMLANDNVLLSSNIDEFVIDKDVTTSIKINIENRIISNVATESIIVKEETIKPVEKKTKPLFMYFIIIAIIVVVTMVLLKAVKSKMSEYEEDYE